MENFNELKQTILERAKNADACSPQFERAENANTLNDLLQVIVDNIYFCYSNKIISADELLLFGDELLLSKNIYVKKHNILLNGSLTYIIYNSTVKAYDNSTVEAFGNSTVKAYDNSTVKAFGNSTVKAFGNSTVLKYLGTVIIMSNNAMIRNLIENKIYVKKGTFEIIEL